MIITFRESYSKLIGELIIEDGNTKIESDVISNGKVDGGLIENFIDVAFSLNAVNGLDEAEFISNFITERFSEGQVNDIIYALRNKIG